MYVKKAWNITWYGHRPFANIKILLAGTKIYSNGEKVYVFKMWLLSISMFYTDSFVNDTNKMVETY